MEFIITDHNQYHLVEIKGRIDSYSAPRINDALRLLINDGHLNLIVDLADVSYISSSGILVFVNIQKQLKRQDKGEIVFVRVPGLILSNFKLSGFDEFFAFYDKIAPAVNRF